MGLAVRNRVTTQNMVDFKYDMKFDDISIPARSFLHLTTQDEQVKCLKNIYHYLNSGGRFLINFFNPNLSFLVENSVASNEFRHAGTFVHPDQQGEKIELSLNQKNDLPEQIQNITWKWKFSLSDKEYLTNMTVRWVYREEFKLLLRLAGFTEWELYGDFDKSQYSYESPEMVWIARKK